MQNSQIEFLRQLVQINSHTWNKPGVDAVGKLVQEYLTELDFEWEVTTAETKGDLLCARSKNWDNTKPVILLNGHLDTVFKDNWEVRIEEGKFYGPGTLDMKAGLLVALEALKELHHQNKLQNIMLLLTPDEEDGMYHIEQQAKYYAQANYAMVFEEGVWDLNNLDLKTKATVVARKAAAFYDINFSGPGGHQGRLSKKEERHSTIHEMARKILELEALANYDKGTVVNVGIVSGGIAANSIAENAYMKVDIRLGSRDELERVEQALKQIFAPTDPAITIDVKRSLFYPSFDFTPAVDKFSQLVVACGREIDLDIKQQFRVSGSEANWISHYNPDCAILDGFGVIGRGDHSQQEFFLIDSFQPAVDLAVKVVSQILA